MDSSNPEQAKGNWRVTVGSSWRGIHLPGLRSDSHACRKAVSSCWMQRGGRGDITHRRNSSCKNIA